MSEEIQLTEERCVISVSDDWKVEAHENSEVRLCDNSKVWSCDNSKVRDFDNSEGWSYYISEVWSFDYCISSLGEYLCLICISSLIAILLDVF